MEWLPRFLSPSDDDDETEIYSNETHTSLWHSNKNTGNATSGGFVEVFPRNHTATTTITPTMNPSMPNATAAANDFFASSSAFLSTQWPMLVLVGLVIVCTVLLCYMTLPILWQWLHRTVSHTLSHSTSRVQRRCETIEGWLISKVCICVCVCVCLRLLRFICVRQY